MTTELYQGVYFAKVAQGSAGTTTIVSAVSGKRVRLIGYQLSLATAGTLKLSGTTSGDLTGTMQWPASVVTYSGGPATPVLDTAPGEGLSITSATGAAAGSITYQLL
ncbi:MAG TPA: hypothetical protein VEY12_05695 [Thermoplasmata archaeon]|nr:hypothetical protein [Thermoplasmata archaeon]